MLPQPSWAQLALHTHRAGKTDELQSLRLPELSTEGLSALEEFCLKNGFLCLLFLSKNIFDPTASPTHLARGYNFQCLSTSACYLLRQECLFIFLKQCKNYTSKWILVQIQKAGTKDA